MRTVIRMRPVLVALALIAGCETQPTALPSGTDAATSSDAAPSPAAMVLDWTRVDLPDAIRVWRATGVIADADGFVVFGTIGDQAAVWTSIDGAAWTSIALPGVEGEPSRAAASSDATVILGYGGTARCAHPFGEFLWQRRHGDPGWTAAPFNEPLFCAGGGANIAANDRGFVVAGTGMGEQPFAWASDDGLIWHDGSAGLSFDAPPWAVSASGPGFLELGRGSITDARESADGRSWSRVLAPPVAPAFNGDLPGMWPAALLDTNLGTFALFESDDGRHFAAVRGADGSWADPGLEGVGKVGAVSGGVVLSPGTEDEVPILFNVREGRASLVGSADLSHWSDVSVPELSAILGLARFGDRLVLVGTTIDANEDEHPSVWVAEIEPGVDASPQ